MWNRSEIEIEIRWIRHGLTKANEEHRYLGKTDEELSTEGIRKLSEKKLREDFFLPDTVFTSPMKRCRQTAEILYQKKATVILEWEEIDFGTFEGKTYLELAQDLDYQKWLESNGTLPFPGGESREAFVERCMQGFEKMCEILRDECKAQEKIRVAAVVHGGTIMAVLSQLTGRDYFDFQVKNGNGYKMKLKALQAELKVEKIEEIIDG